MNIAETKLMSVEDKLDLAMHYISEVDNLLQELEPEAWLDGPVTYLKEKQEDHDNIMRLLEKASTPDDQVIYRYTCDNGLPA